ncbi:hypothetical protein KUTeg_023446 [Tegillarca granosa]|uniref:Uncharacterized protein n=1 Tax=Tegillarca granosa TaxID=220873 RepID=A0ABQ9E4N1_TEGGR|nr:hypothetical protein KUTeg_023446 [Tegillarca granosa]
MFIGKCIVFSFAASNYKQIIFFIVSYFFLLTKNQAEMRNIMNEHIINIKAVNQEIIKLKDFKQKKNTAALTYSSGTVSITSDSLTGFRTGNAPDCKNSVAV